MTFTRATQPRRSSRMNECLLCSEERTPSRRIWYEHTPHYSSPNCICRCSWELKNILAPSKVKHISTQSKEFLSGIVVCPGPSHVWPTQCLICAGLKLPCVPGSRPGTKSYTVPLLRIGKPVSIRVRQKSIHFRTEHVRSTTPYIFRHARVITSRFPNRTIFCVDPELLFRLEHDSVPQIGLKLPVPWAPRDVRSGVSFTLNRQVYSLWSIS